MVRKGSKKAKGAPVNGDAPSGTQVVEAPKKARTAAVSKRSTPRQSMSVTQSSTATQPVSTTAATEGDRPPASKDYPSAETPIDLVNVVGRVTRSRSSKKPDAVSAGAHVEPSSKPAQGVIRQTEEPLDCVARPESQVRADPPSKKPASKPVSKKVLALAAKKAVLEKQEAARLRQLAEIEAALVQAQIEVEENAILSKGDLDDAGAGGSEVGVMDVDENGEDEGAEFVEEDEMDVDQEGAEKISRKRKPARGATRAQLNASVDKILGARGIVLKRPNTGTTSGESKRSRPVTEKGLIRTWEARITKPKPGREAAPGDSDYPLGGLNDEDAAAIAPVITSRLSVVEREAALARAESGQGAVSRRNTEVIEISDGDECLARPRKKTKAASRITGTARIKVEHCESSPTSLAALSSRKRRALSTDEDNARPDCAAAPCSNIDGLLESSWATSLVPALYVRMFASEEPFAWAKGPGFAALIQGVVKRLHPEWADQYPITSQCQTYDKSASRINEKRSEIARHGTAAVARFYAKAPYLNDEALIRRHAQWAIRPKGPAVWANPAPMDYDSDEEEAEPTADGIFLSPVFIETLTPHLKLYSQTGVGCGNPVGLIGLVGASVERAFAEYVRYKNGKKHEEDVKTFTKHRYHDVVYDYIDNAKRLSDRRWLEIYAHCQVRVVTEREPPPVNNSMNRKRRKLYIPSSPIRPA
ncbi:hypothetical protein HDZ31DRAFT_76822 [Schizophyllum fasciatum]